MTVRDYIHILPHSGNDGHTAAMRVSAEGHILDALKLWRNSPDECLDVVDGSGKVVGSLSAGDMVSALADVFTPPSESVVVEVQCKEADYSASQLARAVEDADVQLLGLWRNAQSADACCDEHTGGADSVGVSLLVGASDAGSACRSLRRFGYDARVVSDGGYDVDRERALQRIDALKMILEI